MTTARLALLEKVAEAARVFAGTANVTTTPEGVLRYYELLHNMKAALRALDEHDAGLPCIHGRPGGHMCPHCSGEGR